MADMIAIWLVFTGMLVLMSLCVAGLAYAEQDRKGCRNCLRCAGLAWTWPIAIPFGILYGIYKMYVYAFDR